MIEREKKIKIAPSKLRRSKPQEDEEEGKKQIEVTAGAIDKVVDYAFNPSREKIREMTDINPMQARLLPQLDINDTMWQYAIEVSVYRLDASVYQTVFKKKKPIPPPIIEEFIYRTAQWQKSIHGTNLKAAIDLALAEKEAQAKEEEEILGDFDED